MHVTLRCLLTWLFSAGLVLAQTLGALHHVAHTASGDAQAVVAQAIEAPAPRSDGSWLAKLFGDHRDNSVECHLFAHLSDADGAPAMAFQLPVVAPVSAVLHFLAGEAVARRASLFDARGPPDFR